MPSRTSRGGTSVAPPFPSFATRLRAVVAKATSGRWANRPYLDAPLPLDPFRAGTCDTAARAGSARGEHADERKATAMAGRPRRWKTEGGTTSVVLRRTAAVRLRPRAALSARVRAYCNPVAMTHRTGVESLLADALAARHRQREAGRCPSPPRTAGDAAAVRLRSATSRSPARARCPRSPGARRQRRELRNNLSCRFAGSGPESATRTASPPRRPPRPDHAAGVN